MTPTAPSHKFPEIIESAYTFVRDGTGCIATSTAGIAKTALPYLNVLTLGELAFQAIKKTETVAKDFFTSAKEIKEGKRPEEKGWVFIPNAKEKLD